MTQISRDDVIGLAQLSSVRLTDDEVEMLQRDLSAILDSVEQLNSLDTTDVEPTYQVTDLANVWREDEIDASVVTRDQLLACAPEIQDSSVKVPKVL